MIKLFVYFLITAVDFLLLRTIANKFIAIYYADKDVRSYINTYVVFDFDDTFYKVLNIVCLLFAMVPVVNVVLPFVLYDLASMTEGELLDDVLEDITDDFDEAEA